MSTWVVGLAGGLAGGRSFSLRSWAASPRRGLGQAFGLAKESLPQNRSQPTASKPVPGVALRTTATRLPGPEPGWRPQGGACRIQRVRGDVVIDEPPVFNTYDRLARWPDRRPIWVYARNKCSISHHRQSRPGELGLW